MLTDLADIEPSLDGTAMTDDGRDAVLALAGELSLGWLAGSTTLCVGGQRTVVPNVVDLVGQKLLLYGAAMSPAVVPLTVVDIDDQLNHIQTTDVKRSNVSEPTVV